MNADAFRHFYEYHFAENRNIWSQIMQLSEGDFMEKIPYSHGSVHDQIVHIMQVDEAWFTDLGAVKVDPDPTRLNDRAYIREIWDVAEAQMRAYLEQLTDDMLNTKPLLGEDENLFLWQVLLHVVNHGTDHRAQILRALKDYGLDTVSQDYIFYIYDNP